MCACPVRALSARQTAEKAERSHDLIERGSGEAEMMASGMCQVTGVIASWSDVRAHCSYSDCTRCGPQLTLASSERQFPVRTEMGSREDRRGSAEA